MNLFRAFRRNRTLVFGVVATLALVVSAAIACDFRLAQTLAFLWSCLLMVGAMIACAAFIVALVLGGRALLRRVGR